MSVYVCVCAYLLCFSIQFVIFISHHSQHRRTPNVSTASGQKENHAVAVDACHYKYRRILSVHHSVSELCCAHAYQQQQKKPYKKPRRQKQCCDFEHLCGIDKMARMWSCSTLRTSSSFIFHCLAVTFLLSWAIVRVPRTVRALLQRCHKIIQSYDKQMRLPCL